MSSTPTDIAHCISQSLTRYFSLLEGEPARDVYAMVLCQVEKPMLEVVMAECGGNQSKAAAVLGLNRNTLRKKLLEHGLLAAD
ncbi:helix-turn-helix domain-containing protein [Neisseria leonii]|uniref:Putative Fis-like DNA-binding protein n=1 Tax=Neisseria leonii TaxID=2995413 RepID=A0A9X4E2F8_9NEIS|nr:MULTISPECIES: helix-turn-helix domain-containing protein [unclassified Neisseria]MDD9325913.1 Fis family transcriptional regulator [Neisseria sp. 3986]MDD9327959.1 Fis family transcriptional regulator [Neisseria sp. 51.81]